MVTWLWIGFIVLVLALLTLDLGVFHRRSHVIGIREALGWTAFWVVLALLFNIAIYFMYEYDLLGVGQGRTGKRAALEYLTGYIIEKTLSLDNIFVIVLIFSYFRVAPEHQHRVLFWGILGALVMRGAMILGGAVLIHRFDWMIYVFGGFLLITAVRMMFTEHDEAELERNRLLRAARRLFPVTDRYEGQRLFVRRGDGRWAATPMFLVLLVVESTDVMFAVDSIPAIFAVTRDPFLVFTSNVFAILGLRSLYFALAGVMRKFRYLRVSLVFVLAFVGVKMLLSEVWHISASVSLGVVAVFLLSGLVASLLHPEPQESPAPPSPSP